jgi:hypothetical protein
MNIINQFQKDFEAVVEFGEKITPYLWQPLATEGTALAEAFKSSCRSTRPVTIDLPEHRMLDLLKIYEIFLLSDRTIGGFYQMIAEDRRGCAARLKSPAVAKAHEQYKLLVDLCRYE